MTEYTLADKMRNQFYGRVNACAVSAASRTQSRQRANKTRTAFENTSVYSNIMYSGSVRQNNAGARQSVSAKQNSTGTRRAQSGGNRVGHFFTGLKNFAFGSTPGATITPEVEIKVKRKPISPMFLAVLLISTVLIMFLVISISEVYQTTNRISKMSNELEVLKQETEDLRLQLDEKNDIRTIETIATQKLGMTKEDSLQRRYISLSDGERIDVLEAPEEENAPGGVLLSSFFSSIRDIFSGGR